MAKASDVLNVARSYIGVKESPRNSNNVIFNTDYYGRKVSGSQYSWCVTFCWDVFRLANASKLFYNGKKSASATTVMNYYKSTGQIVKNPQAGDLVFFQFDKDAYADHIGIVESVKPNGSVVTIEGNTSITSNDNGGKVMRRTRARKLIMAFARPKYEAEKPSLNYSLIFNASYYGAMNKDVIAVYPTEEKLFEHFLKYGIHEKRKTIQTFDVAVYKANNKDLRDAFGKLGDDWELYYKHYITYGHKENRRHV